DCPAPRDARAGAALLEPRKPELGAIERAAFECGLDRVAVAAPDGRLAKVEAFEDVQRLGEVRERRLRLSVSELGEAERAVPDHRDDRLQLRCLVRRRTYSLELPQVRVDVRSPQSDVPRGDSLLLEREDHLVAQLGRARPVAG